MDIKDFDTLIDYIVGKEIKLLMNIDQKVDITINGNVYTLLENSGRFTLYICIARRTHCLYSGGTFNQMLAVLQTDTFKQSILTNIKIYSIK